MDPTRTFCRDDSNITPESSKAIINQLIPILSLKGKIPLLVKKNYILKKKEEFIIQDIEDIFLQIELTPFTNIEAYHLASIDMYFDITNSNSGSLAPQVLKFQNYIISGNRNYGFAEYIQYRNMISFIYFFEVVDLGEIIPTGINYGRLHQVKNYEDFRYADQDFYINKILGVDTLGVDIYIIQDSISSIELLIQISMLLILLKDRGDAIISVQLDELTSDILTILTNCFNSITLFKPVTLGINNDKFYIIGKFYQKDKSIEINRLIKTIIKKEEYGTNISGILEKKDTNIINYIDTIRKLLENERYINGEVTYVPNKLKMYLNIT